MVNKRMDSEPEAQISSIGYLLLLLRATQQGAYSVSKLQELAVDQFNQVSISAAVWQELDYILCQDIHGFEKLAIQITPL